MNFYRDNRGVLVRALSLTEMRDMLHRVYGFSYGKDDVSLYRRLQTQGYYWLEMAKDDSKIQGACSQCQEFLEVENHYAFKKQELGEY